MKKWGNISFLIGMLVGMFLMIMAFFAGRCAPEVTTERAKIEGVKAALVWILGKAGIVSDDSAKEILNDKDIGHYR